MGEMDGKEIIKKLEDYFDHPMPSPLNYPNSFKYYIRLYRYKNKKSEIHKRESLFDEKV